MKKYDPQAIEPKWQQTWADTKLYAASDTDTVRPRYYYLVEFPYPSGEGLHVGHVLSYTALDIMARHKRMQGFNVLYPMGWDAFGLPTENFAIKTKQSPQAVTKANTDRFRSQMQRLGLGFDWDREINTSDPQYYKWTQWLFLQLFKAGLAYQAELAINWCPFEKTGLANEEVVDGKHERCGTPVEKKLLKQWLLKITAYADRLAADLKEVDYLDRIASQQVNWIGRSEGAEITFALRGITSQPDDRHSVTVYTTRPDTLFGATFLVVSPEVARGWIEVGWPAGAEVRHYVDQALKASELERQEGKHKTGADTGIKAVHPLTGELLPVWVADYVLGSYGTGAIMAVPAHDERDHEFALAMNERFGDTKEFIDDTSPLRPDRPIEDRQVALAVIKHPEDDKYLLLKAKNWDDETHSFVMGGIDAGESAAAAIRREVVEETGFDHIAGVSAVGAPYRAVFYHQGKQVNRRAHIQPVVVELTDLHQQVVSDDEKALHELLWVSGEEALAKLRGEGVQTVFANYLAGHCSAPLPIMPVVANPASVAQAENEFDAPVYTGYGPLINSGEFNDLEGEPAKRAIVAALEAKGAGRPATKYKLRDWVFSRQHYWGEPIPVVHCATDGVVAVPDSQLPVELPAVDHYEPTDTGESPLAAMTDWVNTSCPTCGGPAQRETDTMPNWAGSSWYYLRYTDPHNAEAFADRAKLDYWTPVDLYNGGMEHTTLHLLYSRFWHKFLFDQGWVPTAEPYARRRSHGMILGPDNQKMSKSRGNVINPDHVVDQYGADTIRLYEMFMGPFDQEKAWSEEHLSGVSRFIYRVWTLAQDFIAAGHMATIGQGDSTVGTFATEADRQVHKTLKKVHHDIENMQFNTAVAALMELVNFLNRPEHRQRLLAPAATDLRTRTVRALVLMLAPFTPYLAEELWHQFGETGSVHQAAWPAYDPELIKDELVTVVVQVNGKLRASLTAPVAATDLELTKLAQADAHVAKYLAEGKVVKTIVVSRKLVNFVVKPDA